MSRCSTVAGHQLSEVVAHASPSTFCDTGQVTFVLPKCMSVAEASGEFRSRSPSLLSDERKEKKRTGPTYGRMTYEEMPSGICHPARHFHGATVRRIVWAREPNRHRGAHDGETLPITRRRPSRARTTASPAADRHGRRCVDVHASLAEGSVSFPVRYMNME